MRAEEAVRVIESSELFWLRPTADETTALSMAIEALKTVKHGHWIPINDQVAKCSLCGMLETTHGKDKTGQALIHKATKKFCPNCGAKMDEEVQP